jgi:serine/threonine-protein kinase RsbW
MIESISHAEVAGADRFECVGVAADAESASCVREEFAEWLERFFDLDPIRFCDLVLAINEALANAAEFAYLSCDRPKTMDLVAQYDLGERRLTARVCDNGVWRSAASHARDLTRGRGIPLMKAASDRVTIHTSADGTDVCLQWDGVPAL